MPKPMCVIQTRQYLCHPETCNCDHHKLWGIWFTRGPSRGWLREGFDTREQAEEYCKAHGYTYEYKPRHWY